MLRSLIVNTTISAAAFFGVSVIGLLLVPVLIHGYGVEQFGLITLARVLLPTGALAVLDLGFSEITAQTIARSRETGDWKEPGKNLKALLQVSSVIAAIAAVIMSLGALPISRAFQVTDSDLTRFASVIRVTACSLLIVLPTLIADGVLKGFEAYRALRATEVVSTGLYAGMALTCVSLGLSFEWVAYAFLVSLLIRSTVLTWLACRLSRRHGLHFLNATANTHAFLQEKCRQMFVNRVLGVGQSQLTPVLLGILVGPKGVAIFDVIARLPRFTKAVFGLLTTTILPFSTRLDAKNDWQRLNRLGEAGLILVAGAVLPPLLAVAAFSDRILGAWLGPEFSRLGLWTGLMFLTTGVQALVSFGGASLLLYREAFASMNRVTLVQLILSYAIALMALPLLNERAFVLGHCVAALAAAPWHFRVIAKIHNLSNHVLMQVLTVSFIALAPVALRIIPADPMLTWSWSWYFMATGAMCLVQWRILYDFVLLSSQRQWFASALASLVSARK